MGQYFLPSGPVGFGASNATTAFAPSGLSAVTGWLRLQASSQSGGEWTNWVDVLNSNPGAINAARRPAVAAAANGLPLADFQTNDCVSWPITAQNLNRDTYGYFVFAAPDNSGAGVNELMIAISGGTGGASGTFLTSYFLNTNWFVDVYTTSAGVGRRFQVTSAAASAVLRCYGIEYDSSVGGDGCLTLSINGTLQSPAASNIGSPAALGQMPSVTGNILFGNFNDGAASSPMLGKLGPNLCALTSKMSGASAGLLTTAARAALTSFEVPS